jgi:hypothetical protein
MTSPLQKSRCTIIDVFLAPAGQQLVGIARCTAAMKFRTDW